MISTEENERNYSKFSKLLIKLISEETFNKVLESIGGKEAIMSTPFGSTIDSGSAYTGGLLENVLKISDYACKVLNILHEDIDTNTKMSVYKVCLLGHLAKVKMYSPNDNQWEREKRGMLYKFNELNGALRFGERSILIAMNAGVKFNEFEYEAMRILDKGNDDDSYSKFYCSELSVAIRQAAELVTLENKTKQKNLNNE